MIIGGVSGTTREKESVKWEQSFISKEDTSNIIGLHFIGRPV